MDEGDDHCRYQWTAKGPLPDFDGKPDFLIHGPSLDSGAERALGVVELKIKFGHSGHFPDEDISQAVRYGRSILENQPLRDHATVCLCTLECVQFVRVFRNWPTIHTTKAEYMVGTRGHRSIAHPGMAQLHAYLTAPAAAHGVRDIQIDGYVDIYMYIYIYIYI